MLRNLMKHNFFSASKLNKYSLFAVLAEIMLLMFLGQFAFGQKPFFLGGHPAELDIQFISENTVRISLLPVRSDGTTIGIGESPVLSGFDQLCPHYQTRTLPIDHSVYLGKNKNHLAIKGETIAFHFKKSIGEITKAIRFDTSSGSISCKLNGSPVFGLGQGAKQFDRRNALYPMVVGSKYWKMKEYGGRVPVPLLISPEGWGILFHYPSGQIDLHNDEVKFLPGKDTDHVPLDFFVMLADSQVEILREFGQLTGNPPLPPRWSLGYMQSHRTLAGPEEVLDIAKTFRKKNLPCDALIYLGTGWCPSGWNLGHGSFTFNPRVFPDPPALIGKLKDLNFHTVFHVVFPPEKLYGTINSKYADPRDTNHVINYWARHQTLKKQGAEGWWPDSGEKLSLNSRVARIRMYFEGDRKEFNSRTFALHRTGFAGMQRFGGWLWSGDVYSTWEQLRNQIPIGLNSGISGIPYWGTDIGGFWPTVELTGELYVRWFQFGTFCPLFRSHGRTWHLRLPWGWNSGDPGPIEITEQPPGQSLPDSSELHNPLVEPICRKYLNLRYQLLPYNYSLAFEASKSCLPFMRPLWLYYSGNEIYKIQDQFLWGRDFLIAPVTRKNAAIRKLYLPEGNWYDFWTSELISGGKEIVREVDLSTMPIYVRAGAVIPMGPKIQNTGESQFGPLIVRVYPGENGEFVLYEDDGHSYDYLQGEYMMTKFHWDDAAATLSVCLENGMNLCLGNQRKITVQLMSNKMTQSLIYSGKPVKVFFDN